MTKTELQKELLEKVKEGVKPSDLKKQNKKDEGYSSEEENIPKAPPLPNQNLLNQISSLKKQLQTYKDFKEADLKIKERYKQEIENLKTSLKSLNNKITSDKENILELEAKIEKQDKTNLQKQATNHPKSPILNQGEAKEKQQKTFFCDSCQLTKTDTLTKRKADAPLEPRLHNRIVYLCSSCSPYVKELSEPNFDKDNNPYKIN